MPRRRSTSWKHSSRASSTRIPEGGFSRHRLIRVSRSLAGQVLNWHRVASGVEAPHRAKDDHMSGSDAPTEQREERRLQGFAVSPGVSRGIAYLHRPAKDEVPRYPIPASKVDPEILRLEAALGATRAQITHVQSQLAAAVGAKEASIFDAHLLVLEDATLLDEVVRGI